MSEPTRIRAVLKDGGLTEVRLRMSHPMEPGTRRDAAGQLVAAHFIRDAEVLCKGRPVLRAQFGGAVSQNPFLWLRFRGASKGDRITVRWTDNRGETRTDEAVVA